MVEATSTDPDERLRILEEEVGRLKNRRKDRWDKLQILLSILVPASIAAAGVMVSSSVQEAQMASAQRIADGNQQVAQINAAVAQAKLIHDFLEPLTKDGVTIKQKRLALEAVSLALKEEGRRLVSIVNESEPEQSELKKVAKEILERRQIASEGVITHVRTKDAKREDQCLDAPPGWSIVPGSVSIDPPVGAKSPRPWGAKLKSADAKRVCYEIWLSRYSTDPTRVKWMISGTIAPQ